jgi:hypothetical protein
MTKEEFIEFIKELGFTQTWIWEKEKNSYTLSTDIVGKPNSNYVAFTDQLKVTIIEDSGIVELILSQMSPHMMVGKNFGNFNIKTFGDKNDFQMELFLSFIKGSFDKVPDAITQYMRDKKIKDIFQ